MHLPAGLVREPPAVAVDVDVARGVDVERERRRMIRVHERQPPEERAHVPQRCAGALGQADGVAGVALMTDRHERKRKVGVAQLGVGLEAAARQDHATVRGDRGPLAVALDDRPFNAVGGEEVDDRGVQRHRDPAVAHAVREHAPQRRAGSLARRRDELAVVDVPGAREVRPRREHPAERPDVDGRGRPAERLEELGDVGESARVGLEHAPAGLAEAQRVEVIDSARPVDIEQEAAGVDAVAAARRCLLDDRDRRPTVVGRDRRRRPGGAEPDDEDVDLRRRAHAGGSVIGRYGS